MEVFIFQNWKKNSVYQWIDQDHLGRIKIREIMAVGCIFISPFSCFYWIFLAQSLSVLRWGKSQWNFYLFWAFGAFNESNQGYLSQVVSLLLSLHIFYYMKKKWERERSSYTGRNELSSFEVAVFFTGSMGEFWALASKKPFFMPKLLLDLACWDPFANSSTDNGKCWFSKWRTGEVMVQDLMLELSKNL